MSKGSTVVLVRITAEMLDEMKIEINRLNHRVKGEPYNRSSFIRKAIMDKLDHIARSRAKRSFAESEAEMRGEGG